MMTKISLKLRNLKLLHAKWVTEMYQYLKQQKKSIIKRFEKSRLMGNLKCANEIYMKCEHSYGDIHSKKIDTQVVALQLVCIRILCLSLKETIF